MDTAPIHLCRDTTPIDVRSTWGRIGREPGWQRNTKEPGELWVTFGRMSRHENGASRSFVSANGEVPAAALCSRETMHVAPGSHCRRHAPGVRTSQQTLRCLQKRTLCLRQCCFVPQGGAEPGQTTRHKKVKLQVENLHLWCPCCKGGLGETLTPLPLDRLEEGRVWCPARRERFASVVAIRFVRPSPRPAAAAAAADVERR